MDPLIPHRRRTLIETPIFSLQQHDIQLPWSGREHPFFILASPDWVHIVPMTADGQVILIRQFRVGSEDLQLEIPGGIIDPTDKDPAEAAARELLEETGYRPREMVYIGASDPNPAILNNALFSYLALDCEKVAEPHFDSSERVEVYLIPADEIPARVVRGEIRSALVLCGFYWADLYRRGLMPEGATGHPRRAGR